MKHSLERRTMLSNLFGQRQTHADVVLDQILTEMESTDPNSAEYRVLAENLEIAAKAKSHIDPDPKPQIDMIVAFAGMVAHVVGVATILKWEEINVWTSKALTIMPKVFLKH